jgi:hypothetical protein
LFSILQHILIANPTSPRLRLTPLVTASLQDWQTLASALANSPTQITSIVPHPPSFLGTVDASGAGIGGAWLPTPSTATYQPIIFRLPFPSYIQNCLVTASNPNGTLTNSDLELAALVTGAAILCNVYPEGHAQLLCASDNSAAVCDLYLVLGSDPVWSTRGSEATCYLLGEVRINRSSRRSVYVDQR